MKKAQFFYLLRRGFFSGGGEVLGPVNEVAPVISGNAERGETLSSTTGTWSGTGTITYAYQWRRNGATISGATSASYVLVVDDDNKFITCLVTATDDEGSNAKASNSLGPVLAAPLNLTSPVASGTAQVGQTLSTTDGTWQGIATITFAYQWRRDAVNISGATSSTYTLVAADYTTDVDCVVTATNSLGSASEDSNDIANIAGTAPSISGVPTLSGTAKVDSTLTATAASVTGVPTPTTSWQWQRSDNGSTGWANISGATSSTYTAVSADETKYLRAVQTETNVIGSDSANSASSAQVAAAFTGLLDTYSGAAAAYSLRLLDTSYTGDAIVVRRASDNTTQSIGFVNNELDTATLESFCSGTDGFVTTWYDQSGNNINAAQTSDAYQPKIVSAGSTITEGTKPVVQFNGGTNYNSLEKQFASSISQPVTIFVASKYNDSNKDHLFDGYTNRFSSGYDAGSELTMNAGTNLSAGTQPLGHILTANIFDTTSSEFYINNVLEASGNTGSNSMDGLVIGTLRTSLGNIYRNDYSLNGIVQEFIIYPNDQSTNRSGIQTNINSYYSIY